MATFVGVLTTSPTEAFLNNTLMMMRNEPPNGTPQQKVYAARAYFKNVLHKQDGATVTVVGDKVLWNTTQVLVVDSAS